MKIVVPCKVVADDQDIVAASDGSLDFSKAKLVISTYALTAIECAAQLAAAYAGSSVPSMDARAYCVGLE